MRVCESFRWRVLNDAVFEKIIILVSNCCKHFTQALVFVHIFWKKISLYCKPPFENKSAVKPPLGFQLAEFIFVYQPNIDKSRHCWTIRALLLKSVCRTDLTKQHLALQQCQVFKAVPIPTNRPLVCFTLPIQVVIL